MDNFKIFLAKYLIAAIVLVWLWVWLRANRSRKIEMVVATVVAGIVALIISRIAAKLYYDPRPFVSQHIKPLITHSADNGFPSDHALLGGTLGGVLFAYARRWGVAALVLAILVATGRVLVHVHSPIDVIAGITIGLVAAWFGVWSTKKYYHPSSPKEAASKKDAS